MDPAAQDIRYSQVEPLSLGQIEKLFDQAVEDWNEYLENDDIPEEAEWDVRNAARILEREHSAEPAVVEFAESRLYDASSSARQIASNILCEAASKSSVTDRARIASTFAEAIRLEGDPTTLAKMLYWFSYFNQAELTPYVDLLAEITDHHDDYVRDRLADALTSAASPSDPRAIQALMRLASDEDDEVRWSAVYGLSELLDFWGDHDQVGAFLVNVARSDPSERIRETASEYFSSSL